MKNHFCSILTLVTTAALLAGAGCSDRSTKKTDPTASSGGTGHADASSTAPAPPVPVTTAPTVAASPDPLAGIALALDTTTKDTTASLAGPQTAMDKAIDEQIAAWKATGATSTPAEEGKLALARTDFSQKLGALSVAHDETWKTAKSNAQSSLQNLRHIYGAYLAGPPKN